MLQHLMFSRSSAELVPGRPAHRAAPPGCTHAAARTAGAWRCGDPGRSLPPPLPLPRASWAGPSRPAARASARARSSSGSAGSRVPAAGPRGCLPGYGPADPGSRGGRRPHWKLSQHLPNHCAFTVSSPLNFGWGGGVVPSSKDEPSPRGNFW